MRKMSIARQIRVQRLQDKNRMVGQTFNPGGHTSESLQQRESEYVARCKEMTFEKRQRIYEQYKIEEKYKEDNNLYYSNSFEHNVFMRHFGWEHTMPPEPEVAAGTKSINLFEIGSGYDFKAITALLVREFGETLAELLKPQEAPENCVQLTIPAANYGRIKETIRLALPLEHYREVYTLVDGKLLKNANGFSRYF